MELRGSKTRKTYAIAVLLGVSSLGYQETSKPNYNGLSISTSLQANFELNRTTAISASASYDLIGLSSNPSDIHLRYLMLDFDWNKRTTPVYGSFAFFGGVGGYISATIPGDTVTTPRMGYYNVGGPQVTVGALQKFSRKVRSTYYFKFAMVGEGIALRGLSDNRIEVGLAIDPAPSKWMNASGLQFRTSYSRLQSSIGSSDIRAARIIVSMGYTF